METYVHVVCYRNLITSAGAVFGGDEDHTVGRTRTGDSCRRSIFQYGYALYGVGVYVAKITLHTVDKHEGRSARTRESVAAANVDRDTLITRNTCTYNYIEARNGTLQHLTHVGHGTFQKLLAVDSRNCAGEVDLLLSTETYHNDVLNLEGILFESNVDIGFSAYGNNFGDVADERNLEVVAHFDAFYAE